MDAFMSADWLGKPAWMWVGIFAFVLLLLVLSTADEFSPKVASENSPLGCGG
jgi:hypothetical protein